MLVEVLFNWAIFVWVVINYRDMCLLNTKECVSANEMAVFSSFSVLFLLQVRVLLVYLC